MRGFLQAQAKLMEYWMNEDGKPSTTFLEDLTHLDCTYHGGGGGGGTTCQDPTADNYGGPLPCVYTLCPTITLIGSVTVGNASLTVQFTAAQLNSGYAFTIQRGSSETGPWTTVHTGAVAGTSFSFTDTGLTNGTTYYYKAFVSKVNCTDSNPIIVHGIPALCEMFEIHVSYRIVKQFNILFPDTENPPDQCVEWEISGLPAGAKISVKHNAQTFWGCGSNEPHPISVGASEDNVTYPGEMDDHPLYPRINVLGDTCTQDNAAGCPNHWNIHGYGYEGQYFPLTLQEIDGIVNVKTIRYQRREHYAMPSWSTTHRIDALALTGIEFTTASGCHVHQTWAGLIMRPGDYEVGAGDGGSVTMRITGFGYIMPMHELASLLFYNGTGCPYCVGCSYYQLLWRKMDGTTQVLADTSDAVHNGYSPSSNNPCELGISGIMGVKLPSNMINAFAIPGQPNSFTIGLAQNISLKIVGFFADGTEIRLSDNFGRSPGFPVIAPYPSPASAPVLTVDNNAATVSWPHVDYALRYRIYRGYKDSNPSNNRVDEIAAPSLAGGTVSYALDSTWYENLHTEADCGVGCHGCRDWNVGVSTVAPDGTEGPITVAKFHQCTTR
jgi:hypothetical protein